MCTMATYEPLQLDASQRGDLCYVLKQYTPAKNRHSRGCGHAEMKEEVFKSPRLQRIMAEVARDMDRELKDVHVEAQALLEEIGHKMMLPALRSLGYVIRKVLRTIYKGIYVHKEGMEQLRRVVEEWPVVILPSHRSYLDFLLVSIILFEYNIQLPTIATGQDFMSMKIVSNLLRRSGAFFLRRTFSSDRLYKAIFTQYVQTLLCACDNPMEFFIEGTRSRTAKSLHPRLGLLSMVLEPYLAARLPDTFLVPMSISYERTVEEQLFARELLGIPKPKESTTGLFKARAILSECYGSIYIHVGSPISLHEFCQARGFSRIPHTLYPKDVSLVLPGERQLVLELGHAVIEHTNQGMRIYPSAMVAAMLLQNHRGIALDDLVEKVQWAKEEIVRDGGVVNWEGDDSRSIVESSLDLLSVAVEVTEDRTVRPKIEAIPLPPPSHRRNIQEVARLRLEQKDTDAIMERGFIHLLLAHYRNQLLHLFIPESMAALSLYENMPCDRETALRRFEALHCGFSREFVLPLKSPAELFSESVQTLLDRGVLVMEDGGLTTSEKGKDTIVFLANLLLPFVAGVWVVCQHIISFANGVQTLNATIKGSQLLAAKCIYTGLLDTYEGLSLTIIRNTLASLTQAQLILQPSSEVELGKDRLVKVADQEKLVQLAKALGSVLLLNSMTSSKL